MRQFYNWLKKYFIPHKENDYKPHFFRRKAVSIFFLGILVIELLFLVQVFIVFDKTKFLASVLPAVLTTLANENRAQNNVLPLVQNELLAKAATLKAEDMATKSYFAHTSPEGKTPWYWLDQVGYNYTMAGENLAVNFFESKDVAQAWMNSPTHRANIVKKDYTEIGIGIANGIYRGKNTVFVAQFFGTPLKMNSAKASPTTTVVQPSVKPKISVTVNPVSTQVLGEETSIPSIVKVSDTANIQGKSGIKLFIQKVLTSPREYLNFVYGAIILVVILALCLAVFIKTKIQHPEIVIRGLALIAIVCALLYVNTEVFHFETNVGVDDITANVIDATSD